MQTPNNRLHEVLRAGQEHAKKQEAMAVKSAASSTAIKDVFDPVTVPTDVKFMKRAKKAMKKALKKKEKKKKKKKEKEEEERKGEDSSSSSSSDGMTPAKRALYLSAQDPDTVGTRQGIFAIQDVFDPL